MRGAVAILASLTLLVVSCRNDETASVAAPAAATPAPAVPESRVPTIDACALLSRSEIESIFGRLEADPKSETGLRGEKQCRYQNNEGQWLKASLYGADRWELERGIVSELHPTPVMGLGDEAFTVTQGTDSVVYVRKGGGVLEVTCSCGMQKAQALTTRAVTKI